MLNVFFHPAGLERLAADWERRFRKFPETSFRWRITYYLWHPQYQTLLYFRLREASRATWLKGLFGRLYERASRKSGFEFNGTDIGGGVIMPHWGRTILNATRIGKELYVFHNVTVGNDYRTGTPSLGDGVFIGAGAIVLGRILIGSRVVIAAGSVVVSDVPDDVVVAGNPARVIGQATPEYLKSMIAY